MRSVLLIGLLVLLCGFTEINLPKLQIICPKCNYLFYNCDVDEIFGFQTTEYISSICTPTNRIPVMKKSKGIYCPLDGTRAHRNYGEVYKWGQVYTNKGWMPIRYRP